MFKKQNPLSSQFTALRMRRTCTGTANKGISIHSRSIKLLASLRARRSKFNIYIPLL